MAAHANNLGMKLDLGDKAFVVASDDALLKGVARVIGVLAGSAAQAVSKFGVDCAISKRGTRT